MLTPLPDRTQLDAAAIPGERFIERAATTTVGLLLTALTVAGLLGATVNMNTTVTGSGELEPRMVWVARPRESGTVVNVSVRTGEVVERGKVLFVLDSVPLLSTLSDLEARLAGAQLDVANGISLRPIDLATAKERETLASTAVARARARLLNTLVDNGKSQNIDSVLHAPIRHQHVAIDLARADVEQAEGEFNVAALAYQRLRADSLELRRAIIKRRDLASQLAVVRERVAALAVRAPAAGVVLTDRLDLLEGRVVHEGEPVLELGSIEGWHAQLLVSETDVRHVQPNQEVQIEFNTFSRVSSPMVSGTVVSVSAEPWRPDTPTVSGEAVLGSAPPRYRVVVALDTRQSDSITALFRRGFTMQARIRVGRERIARAFFDHIFARDAAT